MKYRVAKSPLDLCFEEKEKPDNLGCPYIEFDSKEQYEMMSMKSDSYKLLHAKLDTLFEYFEQIWSLSETYRHLIITDGKIDRAYRMNNEEEE